MAGLTRPVRVTVTLDAATALRLEVLRQPLGMTRAEAIQEAIMIRTIVWEQRALRKQRLTIERVLREAAEWAPIDELLALGPRRPGSVRKPRA